MSLRTDLNGFRVKKTTKHPAIYLIDEGRKRWIPNPTVYDLLFRDWGGIILEIDIDKIPTGSAIPQDAILIRFGSKPAIYLLDGVQPNQVKRHITSPSVMDHYNFDWDQVVVLPTQIEGSFATGNPINNPNFYT